MRPGRELPAPPLDLDRVVAQPRILVAGLGDRASSSARVASTGSPMATPSRPSATSRSGTDDAQSPARTVPIDSGCASAQRAASGSTCSWRRCSSSVSARSIGQNLSIGADAVGSAGGVGRQAAHPEAEGEGAGVGGDDVELGGLGNDAGVGRPAPLQQGEAAEAAVLLALHGCDEHVAPQGDAGAADGLHGPVRASSPAFMSHAPRPWMPVVAQLGRERIVGPGVRGRRSARRRRDRRAAAWAVAGAGEAADQPQASRARPPCRGSPGAPSRVEVDAPVVDLEAAVAPAARHRRLRLVLGVGAADARDANQVAGRDDHDDRPCVGDRRVGRQRHHLGSDLAPHRMAVEPEHLAEAVVRLHEHTDRVRRTSGRHATRRRPDAALELVADHPRAAADVAFSDGQAGVLGVGQRGAHVVSGEVERVDVVEEAVVRLAHDREAPRRVGIALDLLGDEGVAHQSDLVGVRDADRSAEQPGLVEPVRAGDLPVPVERVQAAVAQVGPLSAGTRADDRDAGPGDARRVPDDRRMADGDPGDVRDGVEWPGRSRTDGEAEIPEASHEP
jgi:hypothetical protein